jgi:ubiquinone/menaquinone biosynthesis C-methylase UbiE
MLWRHGLADLSKARLLEVGCGDGWWLRKFVEYGADQRNLRGVELLPDRVERARVLSPNIQVTQGDASRLHMPDGSFDIVLQSTVFSSILDPAMRRAVASEMLRVLSPGGLVIWYDMRVDNPGNPDVRGVPRSEVEALFPGCVCRFRRATLAPPLARRLAPASRALCQLLSAFPFLLTHYLAFISKPSAR